MKKHCSHINDKGASTVYVVKTWKDTAGIEWQEKECRQCGRLYRDRMEGAWRDDTRRFTGKKGKVAA